MNSFCLGGIPQRALDIGEPCYGILIITTIFFLMNLSYLHALACMV